MIAQLTAKDFIRWHTKSKIEKYWDPDDTAEQAKLAGRLEGWFREHAPYKVINHRKSNLLLNAGISLLEDLLIGAGGTTYANANARLGVGDSSTAAAASQTALQAASNKLMQAVDATYPSRASQTLTFKTTFTTGNANFVWNEWVIDNGTTALNRKVEANGTKVSTATWALTVTVVIS